MGPIIEELGKDMDGKAKVAKLNVDENPVQSEKYGVMSIPTMIIFKDGQESERLVGIQQKDTLKSKLEYYTN
ncbi:MAG: Thioredoxin [candidate division CPR3 bacterium GW2011_GWE2_35_7]|nr:MAG: Thioredoxin [candidate division CPR3 bacterium GW2011_GWE2_35_7]